MFFIVVCSSDVKQDKNGSPSVSTRRTLNRKETITMAFTRDSLKQFGIAQMYRSSSSSWKTTSSVCSSRKSGSEMMKYWNISLSKSPFISYSGRFAISLARTIPHT